MSHDVVLVHKEVKFDRDAASRAHLHPDHMLKHFYIQIVCARGGITDPTPDNHVWPDLFPCYFVGQNNRSLGGVGSHHSDRVEPWVAEP